jgi:hypothetical protein
MERVVLVGAGALGSTVARSLVAMGVTHMTLVDPDVVCPGNIARHEARFPDIGKAKIDALGQILRETNPAAEVEVMAGTRGQNGKFDALLLDRAGRPSLVIVTVAGKAVDTQVDAIARRAVPPIPVLHGWVMAEAQMLRAFVFRSGETACVYCNGIYEKEAADGKNRDRYLAGPPEAATPFYEASCSSPAFPGAGNANALAAHVIVEMALDSLQRRLPNERSHWVFAGNRIDDVYPSLGIDALSVTKSGFPPHPSCPVCSETEFETALSSSDAEEFDRELRQAGDAA